MFKKTEKALRKSIEKWEQIIAGAGVDKGYTNCALCKLFCRVRCHRRGLFVIFERCPVAEHSGSMNCISTPYIEWGKYVEEHHVPSCKKYYADTDKKWTYQNGEGYKVFDDTSRELAQKELEFLKSLLPGKDER